MKGIDARGCGCATSSTSSMVDASAVGDLLFLRPVRAQVYKSLVLTAVIALVVALIGIACSHFYSKPIRELTRVVETFSSGDMSVRAHAASRDETGILADTFNSMTTRLRRRIEMEKLVADMSRDFIALGKGDIDKTVYHALMDIGYFVKADRGYVFEYSEDEKEMFNTFEWRLKGIPSRKHLLQGLIEMTKTTQAFVLARISIFEDLLETLTFQDVKREIPAAALIGGLQYRGK